MDWPCTWRISNKAKRLQFPGDLEFLSRPRQCPLQAFEAKDRVVPKFEALFKISAGFVRQQWTTDHDGQVLSLPCQTQDQGFNQTPEASP